MANERNKNEKIILIVGGCGLDRLMSVPTFPLPDSKVRTEAYHEDGGGGAANTATTMGRLKNASFLFNNRENANFNETLHVPPTTPPKFDLKIKLLTKLGADNVGKQLTQELEKNGVDVSSPLFCHGDEGTTTGITTILVAQLPHHTRTCLYTPGTCGALSLDDLDHLQNNSKDITEELFQNVIHLHSDCRHTDISLALAREARRRGIPVSVDAEKDRMIASQDELLELATTLFTNADQLHDYLTRKNAVWQQEHGMLPPLLPQPQPQQATTAISVRGKHTKIATMVANSIHPSSCFLVWYGQQQLRKEVVITKGDLGALRIRPVKLENSKMENVDTGIVIHQPSDDNKSSTFVIEETACTKAYSEATITKCQFTVETSGVLQDITVVDTTGAGDAFVGGYLLCQLMCPDASSSSSSDPLFAMKFGAWVAGKKLQSPGAQRALPTSKNVDEQLGRTRQEVEHSLRKLIGSFGQH